MLYELRIYHCMPGKLPAVLTRFETATVKLFEKHGIQPVWLLDGSNRPANRTQTFTIS